MIAFFERLARSEKKPEQIELLSTHPMSRARADRLKAEMNSLPKFLPEPFSFNWTAVQAALGPGGKLPQQTPRQEGTRSPWVRWLREFKA